MKVIYRYKIEVIVQSESPSWEETQLMVEQSIEKNEYLKVESININTLPHDTK